MHLGAISQMRVPREVWIDPGTRAHQLHSQRVLQYFVITYFDDASAVLTYGVRPSGVRSSPRDLAPSVLRGFVRASRAGRKP